MSDTAPKKKMELPWGVPPWILFLCICLAVGVGFLYDARTPIEWSISLLFRLMGVALIVGLGVLLLKGADGEKKKEKPKGGSAPAPAPGPAPAPAAH
jgi:hypothetical protein